MFLLFWMDIYICAYMVTCARTHTDVHMNTHISCASVLSFLLIHQIKIQVCTGNYVLQWFPWIETYTQSIIYSKTHKCLLMFYFNFVETYYLHRSPRGIHWLFTDTTLLCHRLQNYSSTKHFITLWKVCIDPLLSCLMLILSYKTMRILSCM